MSLRELGITMDMVGPCAAESREQVLQSGAEAKKRGFLIVRSSVIKPRTRPSWDGIGVEIGARWLSESAEINNIIPATEVIDGHDAEVMINAMDKIRGKKRLVLWIGSRNQVHKLQQEIGSAVSGVDWVDVGIKNPMGADKEHWLGAVDHVIHGGASKDQLFMIHRGFKPGGRGCRNLPNWKMMEEVRKESGLPMVADPSHMGGSREKVMRIINQIWRMQNKGLVRVEGLMVEIHPTPEDAATDKGQQFSWNLYDQKLKKGMERWRESHRLPILV